MQQDSGQSNGSRKSLPELLRLAGVQHLEELPLDVEAGIQAFLRAAGGSADTRGAEPGCPSCGAPLDQISQTGVCGYCSSKLTTGRFDWILTRIEQPEAYSP